MSPCEHRGEDEHERESFHAESIGCHIITVTNDVLAKLSLVGKDLAEYSLDTVKMFERDGKASGFTL